MSPIQASALGMRLFAIWLAIYWARSLGYFITEVRDSEGATATVIAVVFSIVLAGFVLLLWFFPKTVAGAILPQEKSAPSTTTSANTWFAVGCTLLGLWVIASAFPGLFQQGYIFLYAKRNNIALPDHWESGVIYYIVQLAIGVWLLLGAAGVRRLVWWARNARFDQAP